MTPARAVTGDTGDTGWGEHSRAIGDKLGRFDLSFVKVGACGPGAQWLDIHMSAEDAVRAHGDLRARQLVPVRWATFNLAFAQHPRAAPTPHKLRRQATLAGVSMARRTTALAV